MIDLEELYAIDPSLREHEDELKKLLTKLERSKPDVKIDSAFVTELRRELLNRPAPTSWLERIINPMNKIPLYVGGAVTIALVALVGYNLTSGPSGDGSKVALSDATRLSGGVTPLGPSAFGSLALGGLAYQSADQAVSGAEFAPSEIARPQSGGGGGLGVSVESSKMFAPGEPYPEYHVFTLKYDGGDLDLSAGTGDVYRRVRSDQVAMRLGALLAGRDNGIMDLSAFGDMRLSGYQMVQSSGDGYMVNVDLNFGNVYINRDYSRGYIEEGYDRNVTESDIPSDAELISKASAFLKKFGIDPSSYAEPVVLDDWRRYVAQELARDPGAQVWYPHVLSVIFPLSVDGNIITDQVGNPHGPNVQINVLDGTVVGAYNIISRDFEKSAYDLETDAERVIRIAERGGLFGYWLGNEKGGTIRLGAPEHVTMYMTQWNEETRENVELFIPSLSFPLLDVPIEASSGPREIVVPLVKGILDTFDNGRIDPPIPMPLEEGPATMEMVVPGEAGVTEMEVIELE